MFLICQKPPVRDGWHEYVSSATYWWFLSILENRRFSGNQKFQRNFSVQQIPCTYFGSAKPLIKDKWNIVVSVEVSYYSNTSKILAFILLLPLVGSANLLPHTRQATLEDALPNIICSFLHLGHLILTNLLVCSLIFTM